jgi:DNA-binding IclR family transcriptional regulator
VPASDRSPRRDSGAVLRARGSKSLPVGVVSKVLRILEALNSSPIGLHLKDIAEQTDVNKSTAYRFLAHLESERYLYRDDSGAYMVGPRLARLGSGISYQTTLRKISRPILQDLWRVTSETVNLGILDGQDVYYLDVVQSPHPFRMASHMGIWRPLYCTSLGKALAAFLPTDEQEHLVASLRFERFTPRTIVRLSRLRKELERIRQRGYALDDQEATLGARCVGAPILVEGEKVAGAISIAGPTTRIGLAKIPAFAKAVLASAQEISHHLGASKPLRSGAHSR